MHYRLPFIVALFCLVITGNSQSLTITPERKIEYRTFENGDRIPDYSYCGYRASEEAIPFVEAKIKVAPHDGDATERIQRAIDYVGTLPIDINGFRGAIQLEQGEYRLDGSLKITNSGIVLRGSGYGKNGTTLIGAGTDRTTLIRIIGHDDKQVTDSIPVAPQYVPLNASFIPLVVGHGLKVGERIIITRPSTQQWIESIKADKIGVYVDYPLTHWTPRDFDLCWERTILEVSPTSVTIDVPLTNSLDPQLGSYISRCQWNGRIKNVGVENLRCISEYNPENLKDEDHRWMAITIENTEDGWVRRVVGQHFVSSIVAAWENVRRFTIEDCKSLEPIGEIGGYRRYAFQTTGQQILFQRCYAEYGFHDFSVGASAAGPNAFVQCYSYLPYSFSGTLGGWSSGTLFDRVTVDGGALKIAFRDVDGQGGGWSGANSLCWEARVAQLHLDNPPMAYNWAFGTWGQSYGSGNHEMARQFLQPRSFYYAQWEARMGKASDEKNDILYVPAMALSKTDATYTALINKRSELPELIMDQWIDTVTARHPFVLTYNMQDINEIPRKKTKQEVRVITPSIEILNGRIVQAGEPVLGVTNRTALWRGSLRPSIIDAASIHLTRFVPGREGMGFTDNIDSVAVYMQRRGVVALNHYPALWYERRRDDHGRVRRVDADVWAPFYEQPFSRSGVGEAFDRLSKYDLDRFNPWYWQRVKQFADVADRDGLLLIQDHYLQHNIIEEGGHWADYPWRSANNINNLGFPENVYYAGDKRVFMAEQFYDTAHSVRVKYHKKNIRKHLDELGDNVNVIHHLGVEYTGPAHFIRFWLDVISEWEQETGKDVKTMISATKDMIDEVLSDAAYAPLIDVIDILQWHYRTDGSLYSPEGGISLTQRQYARIMDVGQEDLNGIYRAITEYRRQYPNKVVVYNKKRMDGGDWVAYLAGSSLCRIAKVESSHFYADAAQMSPSDAVTLSGKQWGMSAPSVGYIIYTASEEVSLNLTDETGNFIMRWIDSHTGKQVGKDQKIATGQAVVLPSPMKKGAVLWLSRK